MILVDTCVWIDFLRGGVKSSRLSALINLELVCINEIILTELIPTLTLKKEFEIIETLKYFPIINSSIFWEGIIELQILNLKKGINNVGIPDLIITQQCIAENLELWTFDKHFSLMAKNISLKLF